MAVRRSGSSTAGRTRSCARASVDERLLRRVRARLCRVTTASSPDAQLNPAATGRWASSHRSPRLIRQVVLQGEQVERHAPVADTHEVTPFAVRGPLPERVLQSRTTSRSAIETAFSSPMPPGWRRALDGAGEVGQRGTGVPAYRLAGSEPSSEPAVTDGGSRRCDGVPFRRALIQLVTDRAESGKGRGWSS
jgi:hypothetical protein